MNVCSSLISKFGLGSLAIALATGCSGGLESSSTASKSKVAAAAAASGLPTASSSSGSGSGSLGSSSSSSSSSSNTATSAAAGQVAGQAAAVPAKVPAALPVVVAPASTPQAPPKAQVVESPVCLMSADDALNTSTQTSLNCPANCNSHPIYGTDIYTDDSSVCTAAVHAGIITQAAGGPVNWGRTAMLQGAFFGSTSNGVSSNSYSAPYRGFKFNASGLAMYNIWTTWNNLFGPEIPQNIDAQSMSVWMNDLAVRGCVDMTIDFIRTGVPYSPFVVPYVKGVQGVGPGNNSYNYQIVNHTYKAAFGYMPSDATHNVFESALDVGTIDLQGLLLDFTSDRQSIAANCATYGL